MSTGYSRLAAAIAAIPVGADAQERYEILGRHPDGRIVVLCPWCGCGWYDVYAPHDDGRATIYVLSAFGFEYDLVRSVERFPVGFVHIARRTATIAGVPRKRPKPYTRHRKALAVGVTV
jgi:hypothetical protein